VNKDDKKVTEQATAENTPSLKEILKAEAAELKAKQRLKSLKESKKWLMTLTETLYPTLTLNT
jgi:hypothetical protein